LTSKRPVCPRFTPSLWVRQPKAKSTRGTRLTHGLAVLTCVCR
jgi:hypothetical protein